MQRDQEQSAGNLASAAPTAVPVLLDTYSACVARNPGAYRVAGRPFTTEYYGIGLREGDRVLARKVDTALTAAFRDGSWTRAWKRTVGRTGVPVPHPPGRAG